MQKAISQSFMKDPKSTTKSSCAPLRLLSVFLWYKRISKVIAKAQ